jgi:hypothetical protein
MQLSQKHPKIYTGKVHLIPLIIKQRATPKSSEFKIKDIFKQMKELEGDLKKLTKRNFRFLKKEKKKFT